MKRPRDAFSTRLPRRWIPSKPLSRSRKSVAAAGRWRSISAKRPMKQRCGRWLRSAPIPRPAMRSRSSLAGLKPVEAGRFVVHGAHDRARVLANRIGIEIEAALAFGTGHHGTTRGCLLAFNQFLKQRLQRKGAKARVLDLGTGSGVLAIAAARVLRTRVMASDIDGRAVMAARGNAGLNRAASFIEVIRVAGCEAHGLRLGAPYDLIFANILLAPLKRMAHPIARLTQAGGRVILSGLLIAQENGALAAYRAQGLSLERRVVLDGWVTLVMRRGVAAHKRRT